MFAESDPKIRVELRKAQMKLQKDIQQLEKQTKTATTIISDNQQAIKMSWRRRELQRKEDESPSVKRKTKRISGGLMDTKKKLLFANTTALTLELSQNGLSNPSLDTDTLRKSPYVSSPHLLYKQSMQQPRSSTSYGSRLQKPDTMQSSLSATNVIIASNNTQENHTKNSNIQVASLPPAEDRPHTSAALTTTSNTIKKDILMKAKELMNIDSKSYDPTSFQKFYSDSPEASNSDILVLPDGEENMTEEDIMKQLDDDEKESFKKVKEEVNIVLVTTLNA
jgi:hypothetical protein